MSNTYPGYNSWPEIHGLKFVTEDGGSLCCQCANRKNGSEANVDTPRKQVSPGWDPSCDQWRIIGAQWAEAGEHCDHCQVCIRAPDCSVVFWYVDTNEDDPVKAAKQARKYQTREGTEAVCFNVVDLDGNEHMIDLLKH